MKYKHEFEQIQHHDHGCMQTFYDQCKLYGFISRSIFNANTGQWEDRHD